MDREDLGRGGMLKVRQDKSVIMTSPFLLINSPKYPNIGSLIILTPFNSLLSFSYLFSFYLFTLLLFELLRRLVEGVFNCAKRDKIEEGGNSGV